ncbi:MAG TPA: retroviral-like aspartic protease family protein [Chthoniobacterales bacterium]|nr:retroviral-like aspartic protease family protein [Chthoniobacterales bacterium]
MGAFYSDCKISSHADRGRWVEVPRLLVDTGSEFTWVNSQTLAAAGIEREAKSWTFRMANGAQVSRPVGFGIIQVEDVVTTDEIVFAERGDLQLLGSRALEGLNLREDASAKRLVADGLILAAGGAK